MAIGILGLGERQRLRLFMWRDPLERFVECLVCIPRDRFNTENRERVGRILLDALDGVALDWTLQLSESRLARVHYIIRCGEEPVNEYDVATIEARLVQAVRAWADDLRDALLDEHGEEDGIKLFKRYERAFPPGYQADWVARSAVADIARIEELADDRRADHQPVPAARGARGDRAPQAVQLGRRAAVRRAADARAPGRQGGRRASLRDHAGRRQARRGSTTSACRPIAENTRAGPRPPARRVPRRVAGRARGRRPERPGPRRHPDRPRRCRSSARWPSTCARAGSASRTPTSSAR